MQFEKCRGSMCDAEIQERVWQELCSATATALDDMFCGVSTNEGSYDVNVYGETYGAGEGYLNVVLYPVYEIDDEQRTEYSNVVGRASVRLQHLPQFRGGGEVPTCVWSVWVGGVEVNDNLITYEEARKLAFSFEQTGYDDVVISKQTNEDFMKKQITQVVSMWIGSAADIVAIETPKGIVAYSGCEVPSKLVSYIAEQVDADDVSEEAILAVLNDCELLSYDEVSKKLADEIDDSYYSVTVCDSEFSASHVLRSCDPVKWKEMVMEWVDSRDKLFS